MELAELQSVWNVVSEQTIAKYRIDENVVSGAIHKKSNTEIAKIKRALLLKLGIGSVVALIAFASAILAFLAPTDFNPLDIVFNPTETVIFYTSLALSISVMLFYNYRAFQKIKAFQSTTADLKSSLGTIVKTMQNVMTLNIYSDTFMSPILLTWGYYASVYKDQVFTWDLRALVLLLLPFVLGIFAYYFQRYMQQQKFGNYVDRLKEYLGELEGTGY